MSTDLDLRDFAKSELTPSGKRKLRKYAKAVSQKLPRKHTVIIEGFDPLSGNPSRIGSKSSPKKKGNYVQRALEHLQATKAVRGLANHQVSEHVASPIGQETSSGAVAVHVRQLYKGISVFQADETVLFAPNGSLRCVLGSSITVREVKKFVLIVSAKEAVQRAAQYVGLPRNSESTDAETGDLTKTPAVELAEFEPELLVFVSDTPELTTFFSRGPFADRIKASLVWFPMNRDLRLSWQVILALRNFGGRYRVLIDASTSEVLYCRQLTCLALATGNVHPISPAFPREVLPFPLPLQTHVIPASPPNLPAGFPDHWVHDSATAGNCSFVDKAGDLKPLQGVLDSGIVVFDPDDTGSDQSLLNAFYHTCRMHDFFYLLGFREADGNFQFNNFGRGGIQNDLLHTRVFPIEIQGFANLDFRVDGVSPLLNLGLAPTGRHTAFDATMVIHEYTHGVTKRIIGGHTNSTVLEAPQSNGMSEGWSDYFACTVTGADAIGAWCFNNLDGLRGIRYTSTFPAESNNFGLLGTGAFVTPHRIGTIWCATLLEMNRRIGSQLGMRIVFDALRISTANPSFLDMRQFILMALDHLKEAAEISPSSHLGTSKEIWGAFAKFGMGPRAQSNGPLLTGIVPDFEVPSES